MIVGTTTTTKIRVEGNFLVGCNNKNIMHVNVMR